ncbi:acetate--CoA ligase family protein [Rhizobium sp. L1K21]|uniref:acetate--CoA ligase family protein n=1 Tax=Rhizobium sp. L1K21 TaxID=2954933 RepID=UPI0020927CD2|nr:acetate--CoA ligase family protein [Rhizobium sp. L1K21]MCO6188490.1 acetate--CoA ligase family protein [Rhizobium sp. L1K21]
MMDCRTAMAGREALNRMFRPRTVAVVGASASPTKIGGLPVDYLKTKGFAGQVLPINPNASEVQGLKAYPSLVAAPGPIDLAIVAVPAAMVEAALEDAIAAGVPALVIFSSDFAETGEKGAVMQARLAARAAEAGVRLLGPNCLGFMTIAEDVYATFSPVVHLGKPKKGGVGIVSQSGAFGAYALTLARLRGIGISHWITTGNEADLGFAECVEWLASDPETEVIVGYMEGARDGARLLAAFEACRLAGKPLVMAKVGRSAVGAQAAASHTAALAGEDAIFDGVFRQYGVIRGDSIEHVFDIAYAAAIAGVPRGNRAGLYTVSGGAGVMMADEAAANGLEVPELTRSTQDAVLQLVPFAGTRNPLDITGQVVNIEGAFRTALGLMAKDGTVDTIISFVALSGLSPTMGPEVVADLSAVREEVPEIAQYAVTVARPEIRAQLEAAGIPVFEDPNRAVRAVAALAAFAASLDRETGADVDGIALAIPQSTTEPEALKLLGDAGLPVTPYTVAATSEEAVLAAEALGGPVAVKVVSPDILHKTEAGGVRLNLAGAENVRKAAEAILGSVKAYAPNAQIDGLLVAPMTCGVAEVVIGVQHDSAFGPVVMFGMGGVHVEALRDVTFRAAPVSEDEALRMIGEIRALRLLTEPRGAQPADLPALARLIAQVSRFAAANADGIETLDLNPVIVGAQGEGAIIVDALLVGL